HRIAELDLRIGDAVAAQDHATGFLELRRTAFEDLFQVVDVSRGGPGQDGQGRERPSSHGVHIAHRIGRGDRTEGERIVDDGSKEVYRLHQGEIRPQTIYARVIRRIETDENVFI